MQQVTPTVILLALIHLTTAQVVLPPGTMPIANPKDPCVEMQNLAGGLFSVKQWRSEL